MSTALDDWDLRLLLDTANGATAAEFDADFQEDIPLKPKRRKLYHALKNEFASLSS